MINDIDFSRLYKRYQKTDSINNTTIGLELPLALKESIENIGGNSFNNGLFTIYTEKEIAIFTQIVEKLFPQAKGKIYCFGRDWLNRQFALTNFATHKVLQFDANYRDITHIDIGLKKFYEEELIVSCQGLCAVDYFREWGKALKYNEVAGYIIPLALGGKDNVFNMQTIDAEVDIDILSQL